MFKSLAIAISMYSRIPMPQFEWKEKDMRYAICFFPVVGLIIGVIEYLLWLLGLKIYASSLTKACILIAIPLMVTGGIHADGFIDTSDAFSSFQDKEKKLEIMKDPHVGAFGILRFVILLLIYLAFANQAFEVCVRRQFYCIFASFMLARCLSGFAAVTLKSAKTGGTLQTFIKDSNKNAAAVMLLLEAIAVLAFMFVANWKTALGFLICSVVMYIYYIHRTKKQLGGITGDTEGWYLCIQETAYVVTAVVVWYLSILFI